MKHNEKSRLYEADDGKMFVRTSDGKTVGDAVCLGDNDDIGNYEEREFTDGQRAEFFEGIGMEDPKKRKDKARRRERKRRPDGAFKGMRRGGVKHLSRDWPDEHKIADR